MTKEEISYNLGLLFQYADMRSRETFNKAIIEECERLIVSKPSLMYFVRFTLELIDNHPQDVKAIRKAIEELTDRYENKQENRTQRGC